MRRLGLYSGRVYDDNEDYYDECCLGLTDEQANDEDWLDDQRLINRYKCLGCYGCPMSVKKENA